MICYNLLRIFSLFSIGLLAVQGYGKPFLYIVDNSVPPGTGSVAVLDQETFMPIAGSPYTTFTMTGGDQILGAMSRDGTKLYVAGFLAADAVSVMDVDPDTGAITNVQNFTMTQGAMNLPFDQPFGIAVGPDESVYITNFGAMASSIYKVDSGMNYIASIATPFQNLAAIVIDSTGTNLYCVSTGNSMILRLDTNLAGFTAAASGGTNPYAVAIHPNDTYVYATHNSSEITRFDPDLSNPLTVTPPGSTGPVGMAFDPDGTRMYVANAGGGMGTGIMVLDTTTLMPITPILPSGGTGPFFVGLDPEGERLYITNAGSSNLYVLDNVHDTYPFVYDSGAILGVPYSILFTASSQLAPAVQNLTLKQFKNDFGLFFEQVNRLNWTAPASSQVAGYYIYRNFELIATLGSGETQYEDHNTPLNTRIVYSVSSFDSNGNESDPFDVATP